MLHLHNCHSFTNWFYCLYVAMHNYTIQGHTQDIVNLERVLFSEHKMYWLVTSIFQGQI